MSVTETMKDRLFTMRMSEDEYVRLSRVAERYGLNSAGVIRMLLKREDDAIPQPAVKPSKPRR